MCGHVLKITPGWCSRVYKSVTTFPFHHLNLESGVTVSRSWSKMDEIREYLHRGLFHLKKPASACGTNVIITHGAALVAKHQMHGIHSWSLCPCCTDRCFSISLVFPPFLEITVLALQQALSSSFFREMRPFSWTISLFLPWPLLVASFQLRRGMSLSSLFCNTQLSGKNKKTCTVEGSISSDPS